ncbi:MAG: aminoacyl-tRNA hydrolase [Desulfovibrio sp.]|nr:aminoacyl-tRNA hydrolase [Desulfovibrio sp.]MCA1986391.1 aminoacyl-tRNA hydrolase [Desulfovibrio sp.]
MADVFAGLVAGLGNPGRQYEGTRHNFGFLVLDEVLRRLDASRDWQVHQLQDKPGKLQLWRLDGPDTRWLALKPLAFMNLSGEAVGQTARYYRILPEDVLILHDELDLPLGRMKLKFGGGPAGHNGIRSVISHLGGDGFHRLRLGVGRPAPGETREYVLTGFAPQERPVFDAVLAEAADGVLQFLSGARKPAQERINRFRPAEP